MMSANLDIGLGNHSGGVGLCLMPSERCSVMHLKIVECRKYGADIMRVTISLSESRRNADSSINGDQKMSMFR